MNFKKEKLDFSNKQLSEFPTEIFEMKKLRKLSLRNNSIKTLPKEIANLKYLETLDLSNNKITNVFAKLFDLINLRILILDNNQIVNLPKQINNLKKLKILSVSNNRISQIPMEIKELTNLEELNLSSNLFEKFPGEIFELAGLKTLYLSKNNFKDFPVEVIKKQFSKLQRIYCYSHNLESREGIDLAYLEFTREKGNSIALLQKTKLNVAIQGKNEENEKKKIIFIQNKSKIFISYSHQDKIWLDRIKVHLKALRNEGLQIDVWDDTKIKSGQKWEEEIAFALSESYIAILIISADFLASDFIVNNELPPLLQAATEKGTKIIPIIASPCRFIQNKNLSCFQSINDPQKEILSDIVKSIQEKIFVKLANDIERYIEV